MLGMNTRMKMINACPHRQNKLFEKFKTILTKIEGFQFIGLNALLDYDDRYIKTKLNTYGDKV